MVLSEAQELMLDQERYLSLSGGGVPQPPRCCEFKFQANSAGKTPTPRTAFLGYLQGQKRGSAKSPRSFSPKTQSCRHRSGVKLKLPGPIH